jgi:hypothetical protein
MYYLRAALTECTNHIEYDPSIGPVWAFRELVEKEGKNRFLS